MNKILVYSSTTCPYCVKAKRLLSMLNLDYEEINCDENFDETCANLSQKYNQPCIATVPQIIINDRYVGGYDNLESLYKSGELKNYLNASS